MAKLCAVVVVALLFPSVAAAHLRTGTVAVDYHPRVTRAPHGPVTVGVYLSDRALHLAVAPGHSVVVLGYLGEPFLRIGATGVAKATGSPTTAATRVTLHGRSAVWHDVRTSASRWSVPIVVDGRRETIAGATERLKRPSIALWIVVLLAIAGVLVAARSATAAGLLSASAAIVVAAGFALSTYASPGTWIAGLDELAFAAAGVGVLRFGPAQARVPSAAWLALVGLAVALSKGEVFLHALVLSALPGTLTRLLAATALGAGLAGTALAARVYLR